MMSQVLAVAAAILTAQPVADAPRDVANKYLRAIEGSGNETAKEYLLGGVTLSAELCTIPNWKIIKRYEPRIEAAKLADAVAEMKNLDARGRKALDGLLKGGPDDEVKELTRAQAEKMMQPTKTQAERFKKLFPVFAYVARVDKEVYWHPKNPWRVLLDQLGSTGSYKLELHMFDIEEVGHKGVKRVWPLRVLRIKTDKYDSGWKVLPASDWDPES